MSITVEPHSMSFVLYPHLRMSALRISVAGLTSQVFRLWMAEGARAKDAPLYNQAREAPQEWIAAADSTLRSCEVDGDRLRLEAIVQIEEDHLRLRYELTNTGDEPLIDLHVGTCYQLAEAEDFRDQTGERTFAWADGRLANIGADGVRAQCHDHHDPDKSSFMTMPDGDRGVSTIAVRGRSGAATAMAWESHNGYSGNTDPALNCIHGGPDVERLDAVSS